MIGAVELGLIYGVMALGVYLTFRVLQFPDLTVDGSFT
ncbi:MAG: ABC transporter permease, partial [Microbacterium gubbeenense]